MEQDLDYMANYLAEDLANVNVYDVNLIKAKIKASLRIILDTKKENINVKTDNDLKSKVGRLVLTNKLKDIELKFWKQSLRQIVSEQGMKQYYDKIDSELRNIKENKIYKK
jgi:hypothetical protein